MTPKAVTVWHALYTMSEVPAPIGGVCFSLPSPPCRGAARSELCSAVGQAKACATCAEALTQQFSASCLACPNVASRQHGDGKLKHAPPIAVWAILTILCSLLPAQT